MATSSTVQPMSLEQFGQTIKAKHPEYGDLSDADVATKVLAKYPQYHDMVQTAQPPAQAPQEGFFGSLAHSVGLPASKEEAQAAADAQNPLKHPVQAAVDAVGGPALQVAQSAYAGAKRSGGELLQAAQDAFAGNKAGAAVHGIKAIPFVGPGMEKATDQYAQGNYAGEAGTLLGTAAQAAPAVLGAADTAGVPRPNTSVANIASKISPSAMKESAGSLLQSVAKDANSVPVKLENSNDAALRLMDWQGKTQLGPTVNKFLNRITKPNAPPLTYSDARDYYQLLGRLSSDEASKLPPAVQRDLTQMVVGLKQDIGNSADQVGRAADYYKGMGDYATAMRLQGWVDFAKNALTKETVKGIAKGVGVGAGGALGYQVYQQSQK